VFVRNAETTHWHLTSVHAAREQSMTYRPIYCRPTYGSANDGMRNKFQFINSFGRSVRYVSVPHTSARN